MKAQPASLSYTAEHSVAPIAASVETGGTAERHCYGDSCEGEAISNHQPTGLRGNHYAWEGEVVELHITFLYVSRTL